MFPGKIKDLQVPDNIPVDLKAKLIVCLIHLHVIAPLEVGEINILILLSSNTGVFLNGVGGDA